MELNPSQKRALDMSRDILVSAGAGSGKTRVLVARFLYLLENDPGLSMDNIVAITFTEKAAAELRERIHKELAALSSYDVKPKPQTAPALSREDLGMAYIGTIHSFCRRILGEFALEAGVDAEFQILDEDETEVLIRDAIDFTLFSLAQNHNRSESDNLRILLRYIGSGNLRAILHDILYRRDIMLPHIRRFLEWNQEELLKSNRESATSILMDTCEFREVVESINASCLKAIAEIFMKTSEEYEKRKGYGTALDFDDLLIKAVYLVETNSSIRNILKRRFRHFLVDEFQDTDPLQWRLFHLLTDDRNTGCLFLVGDPKQSIYGFRRADVRFFYKAQEHIYEKNRKRSTQTRSSKGERKNSATVSSQSQMEDGFGLIRLRENYRSDPVVLDFVNYFFSRIMPPLNSHDEISYDVSYESLIAQKPPGKGKVEILFADPDRLNPDHPFCSLPLEELEAEFIALRVKELIMQTGPETFTPSDFALLLRSRGYLKSYEEALIRHGIPFVTIGGVGFYERQEIFDLANFLQCLISPENDPALFGLLRSPFLRVPDAFIFQTAQVKKDSLWERLQQFIKDDTPLTHETDKIRHIVDLLKRYIYESQRKPLALLLKEFLTETGGWAALAAGAEGTRCLENVEKLLEQARQFDASGFRSLSDFTEELMTQIENAEKEGEAPQPESTVNAVKIMTIHKAKGLEFPVVILPGLSSSLRTTSNPFCIDETHGLAMKIADPETNFELRETCLFSALKEIDSQKQVCEEKRLFYVGVTRAEKSLILSCTSPRRNKGETRQSWLNNVFDLEKAAKEGKSITFTIDNRKHLIPVNVTLPELTSKSAWSDIAGDKENETQATFDTQSKDGILSLLLPLPETGEKVVISVTRLNIFNHCALKYYLEHLLGWREDILNKMIIPKDSSIEIAHSESPKSLVRGVILHRLIQDLISFGNLPDDNLTISSAVDKESSLSKKERDILIRDIQKAWSRIKKIKRINELIRLEKKYTELPFTISLGNGFLQGRVDLCFFENKRWNILDFKTGFLSSKERIAGKRDYEIQMECYGLFLSVLAPDQEIWPVYLYFVESDHNEIREFNRIDLESTRKRIETLTQKERCFREQYSGKRAVYGKEPLNKLLDQTCPECGNFSSHECPCKMLRI
jgi:ATP-dependent helicase/nuclease subunit A